MKFGFFKTVVRVLFYLIMMTIGLACSNNKGDSNQTTGTSYSFTTSVNGRIESAARSLAFDDSVSAQASTNPTLCSSVICITPTAVTGKYFGTGLSIQSNGSGMMAYFGQESWSGITGASPSYSFSASSPIVNAGTLTCCVGIGDLSGSNTYIESVAYLFGYIDVTFALSGITGNVAMNGTYTVRFVLATGAIPNGVRGDILLLDSGTFKWMNSTNDALSTVRPTSPVKMNSSVVDWVNPFGTDKGNQEIPVIYALAATQADQRMVVTEADLKMTNSTFVFGFNRNNFVMFPTLLHADLNMITSVRELLNRIHLAGLPHSSQPMGAGFIADSELTITP